MPNQTKADDFAVPVETKDNYRAICEEHKWTGPWRGLPEDIERTAIDNWTKLYTDIDKDYNDHIRETHP